jgi:ParB family chromosome partitioning protein
LIQPITVRRVNAHSYQLISGERRLRASKMAGLTQIPAYVRTANDQQMLEMALIENIQRENLNAIEVALSFQRMIDECSLKQEELGDRVSKNRSTVTNYLRLLKLPPTIQASSAMAVLAWAMPKLYWLLKTQPFSFISISKLKARAVGT